MRLLYRFRVIASYLPKVTHFNLPHLHFLPLWVIPVEFRGDLWNQKTRVPGLSCGVVCVIHRLAFFIARRYASTVYAVVLCLSVCLSHAHIVSKRLTLGSCEQRQK